MDRATRKLVDKMARAAGVNTRGKRAFKRHFIKSSMETRRIVEAALLPYAGQEVSAETLDAIKQKIFATVQSPDATAFETNLIVRGNP